MTKRFVFNPRIIRSPLADFYGREIETSLQVYSDDYLRAAAAQGFNGIWLHVVLRDAVCSSLFPGDRKQKQEKMRCLNRLVERTARFGVKVYLYFCEPRSFRDDHPFWKTHSDISGQPFEIQGVGESINGRYLALCTSTPAVQEFLEESPHRLFQQAPGLGGVFMITASEYHTNCYSHFPLPQKVFTEPMMKAWSEAKLECPRCRERSPSDVVAEVIRLVNRGIKSAAPDAEVIAWTWSWYILEPDPQPKLIRLLPRDVILMSDLERGGFKNVVGKRYPVDEYSFSCVGPSPRFKAQLRLAKKRGLRVAAKIQIGNTHELASIPYLPVPWLLAEKLYRMHRIGVNGYLGCWIFGGDLSLMSRLAGMMSRSPQVSPAEAVNALAQTEFGERHGIPTVRAWRKFSNAWQEYPFSIPFLYWAPISFAPAYPFSLRDRKVPGISNWLAVPRDANGHLKVGDYLDSWVQPFRAGVVIRALRNLVEQWGDGIDILRVAVEKDPAHVPLRRELGLARHVALSVQSTIHIVQFYSLLRRLHGTNGRGAKNRLYRGLRRILEAERTATREDRDLVTSDPRLGYHSEAHISLFTVRDLRHKLSVIEADIRRLERMRRKTGDLT